MKAAVRHQLDPTIRSNDTRDFHASLRAKIVGQEEGVQSLVDMFQVFCAGLNSPGRPVGNLLFLGPTGSGKTRIVEAAQNSSGHPQDTWVIAKRIRCSPRKPSISGIPIGLSSRCSCSTRLKKPATLSGNCCWACWTRPR